MKDFVNCMNESELYPPGKEETMDIFNQGSNIMAFFFFSGKNLAAEYMRDWR